MFFLKNSNSTGFADTVFAYGAGGSGDTPLVGDWTGSGKDTIGLYDPKTSMFFLRNSNSTGFSDTAFVYGPANAGWTPLVGDWTAGATDTIGLYNPTTSMFFLRNSNSTGFADTVFVYGPANRDGRRWWAIGRAPEKRKWRPPRGRLPRTCRR